MNLANKITLIRIFLIPVFLVFMLLDFPYSKYIATFVFIVAASSDGIDGYIARKRNEITNFGKFTDPLADKLLIMSALVILVEMGKVSSIIAIVIIARELIVTGFRMVAASEGVVIAASWWGKIKTVTQIIAIVAILLDNIPFKWVGIPFDQISLYIALMATIISGIDYIYKNRKLIMYDK